LTFDFRPNCLRRLGILKGNIKRRLHWMFLYLKRGCIRYIHLCGSRLLLPEAGAGLRSGSW
jgi:hypothetical protein